MKSMEIPPFLEVQFGEIPSNPDRPRKAHRHRCPPPNRNLGSSILAAASTLRWAIGRLEQRLVTVYTVYMTRI